MLLRRSNRLVSVTMEDLRVIAHTYDLCYVASYMRNHQTKPWMPVGLSLPLRSNLSVTEFFERYRGGASLNLYIKATENICSTDRKSPVSLEDMFGVTIRIEMPSRPGAFKMYRLSGIISDKKVAVNGMVYVGVSICRKTDILPVSIG